MQEVYAIMQEAMEENKAENTDKKAEKAEKAEKEENKVQVPKTEEEIQSEVDNMYIGCFETPNRTVLPWGKGNRAMKSDGNIEFRPGDSKKKMSEYEMIAECDAYADPPMRREPYVIGLQNANQCFYLNYNKNDFQNRLFKNKYKPYGCDRTKGGSSGYTQFYKLNPEHWLWKSHDGNSEGIGSNKETQSTQNTQNTKNTQNTQTQNAKTTQSKFILPPPVLFSDVIYSNGRLHETEEAKRLREDIGNSKGNYNHVNQDVYIDFNHSQKDDSVWNLKTHVKTTTQGFVWNYNKDLVIKIGEPRHLHWPIHWIDGIQLYYMLLRNNNRYNDEFDEFGSQGNTSIEWGSAVIIDGKINVKIKKESDGWINKAYNANLSKLWLTDDPHESARTPLLQY